MKRIKLLMAMLLVTAVFQFARAQDVDLNINMVPAFLEQNHYGYIEVSICNLDANPITAPANKLRPLISVPGNVTITGVTDVNGNPLTGWTVQSLTAGTGNTIRLLGTVPLPNTECFLFHVTVLGVNIGPNDIIKATLGFQGPQTPGNYPANDNSDTGVSVICEVPAQPTLSLNTTPNVCPTVPFNLNAIVTSSAPAGKVLEFHTSAIPTALNVVADPTMVAPGTYYAVYHNLAGDCYSPVDAAVTVVVTACNLPVKLISFSATKMQEGKNAANIASKLAWATTEEINADNFSIERSANAKDWTNIGKVAAAGESKILVAYSFKDAAPIAGLNYYRLKMIDKDDTFAYSSIKSVNFDSDAIAVSLYPNPVTNTLFLKDVDLTSVKEVAIINVNGVTAYKAKAATAEGINVANLTNGIYLVKVVKTDGTVSNHKVVIAK